MDFLKRLLKKEEAEEELEIGDPTDFHRQGHIGFNQTTTEFELENMSSAWADLFVRAGVSPEDLKDKETVSRIMSLLIALGPEGLKNIPSSSPAAPEIDMGDDMGLGLEAPAPEPTEAPAPPPPRPAIPSDLAAAIRGHSKTKLKKVEPKTLPDPSQMNEGEKTALANMLKSFLAQQDGESSDGDGSSDF
eukprot:gnl/Dysnectes_brevis/222_a253_6603.p1 GENE.gnl/Dysnectes_brevis/222_a253_6603~~gnl/Dysnectes_brevis/222_a253_6603.p1  ORF type:complete len:190 (+),score=73.66 gnl/Dysnectes_brevis/222_a253_6603:68-637(+)